MDKKMDDKRIGVHLSHCYQGENENNCKYGDDDCPAYKPPKPNEGSLLTELEVADIPNCEYLSEADREPGGTGDWEYEDFIPLLEKQRDLTASIKDAEWDERCTKEKAEYGESVALGIRILVEAECQARIEALIEEGQKKITDLMFENGFSTLVYFHPGEGHRDWADRWVAGILTGRDNDLICVKYCKTVEEGERWLSPSASDPLTAIERAIALKATHTSKEKEDSGTNRS